MKDTFYYVTTPPRVGKLMPDQVLDGRGYPTFNAARRALVKALRGDIVVYKTWIAIKKKEIEWAKHLKEGAP